MASLSGVGGLVCASLPVGMSRDVGAAARITNMVSLLSVEMEVRVCLNGCGVGLTGADAHRMVEAEDEDLTVADLSGFRCGTDRLDDLVH